MKAMIFAAGMGTRFKPWTDQHPKALAPVNGKSLLQRNIEYLAGFGIKDIVINVHHFANQVEKAIQVADGWGSRISISDEREALLETGGGLKKAAGYFDSGPFLVVNVDILTDLDIGAMIRHHEQESPLATLAVTNRHSSRYFLFNGDNRLCGWRNIATGREIVGIPGQPLHPMAFSGIHIIEPRIFSLMQQEGKFSMVDVYLALCATQTILAFDHSGGKLVDVGRTESLALAEKLFA